MVNSKKIIAGLGVVAGLGVAMLPLTSYAIDDTEPSAANAGYIVRVGVADTLAIESVSELWTTTSTKYGGSDGANDGTQYIAVAQGATNDSTFAHIVRVKGSTRNDYGLYMYGIGANNGDATDLTHTATTSATFESTTGGAELGAGEWGAKVSAASASAPTNLDNVTFSGNWLAIGTLGTGSDVTASMTTLHAASGTHNESYDDYYTVLFGAHAADDQLAGTYEGKVVYYVTAANSL
ncbi:hypothetical protein IJ095_00180 [Candidatus Saccharibacteria bacterium]|nr:hypothetical protein [Candidatus Saccharibacteria bacterium]